ncbi:hypothetical protein M434DRAFT_20093 [Hypoxylon sp. CO27-5]|nr:hypothetical protein M434DRAFT_20093 [Hypoxylon sp. CO27-5]
MCLKIGELSLGDLILRATFAGCITWLQTCEHSRMTGIYAPELVVFTAWMQWCSARLLQQLVEKSLKDSESGSRPAKYPTKWTMAHSFFACTGGFAFELAALDRVMLNPADPVTDRPQRLTLTARGMAILAKCGQLPSIRKEDIEDKSKANNLAKATVIVQATWMLVQVIGRLASKLSVTPLEVNTVAHVLCAFLMYLFWWNKPLLPNEPTILDAEELVVFRRPTRDCFSYFKIRKATFIHYAHQTCISELQARREKEQGTAFFETRPRVVVEQEDSDHLSILDMNRWALVKKAFQTFPVLYEDRVSMSHRVRDNPCIHFKAELLVADYVQNWPSNDLLHLVHPTPTTAETWLWRASALYIGFCGGLWVILNFLVAKIPALNIFWDHWMYGEKTWWQNLGLGALVFLCGFSLVLARMFIVVEAIVSIRELPASAYQTPEWIDLFPHL